MSKLALAFERRRTMASIRRSGPVGCGSGLTALEAFEAFQLECECEPRLRCQVYHSPCLLDLQTFSTMDTTWAVEAPAASVCFKDWRVLFHMLAPTLFPCLFMCLSCLFFRSYLALGILCSVLYLWKEERLWNPGGEQIAHVRPISSSRARGGEPFTATDVTCSFDRSMCDWSCKAKRVV